jgi:hypothetical protein
MRTIHVSGGFTGTAVLDLADSRAELDGATFKACLRPEGTATPPPVDDVLWLTPTVDSQDDAGAVIAKMVDNATPAGYYNLALDILVEGRHETVWAVDPEDTDRRALIRIT